MNPRRLQSAAALLSLLVTAGVHAQSFDLPTVSRHVDKQITAHDTVTIHEDGAAFIVVCFSEVTAPVKVRSPDGRESRTYTPGKWKQATRRGQDTCALSISGDTAVVEFLGNGKAEISGYDVGLPQSSGTPETTCGVSDFQWMKCAETEEPEIYERRRPVGRLLMLDRGAVCTAWRIGPGNMMMTNNHCINTPESVAASEVWFQYEFPTCDGTGTVVPVKIPAAELLETYRPLDFTLFSVQDDPALQNFGWFGIDASNVPIGTELYITGHPQSKAKRYLRNSDQNESGVCQVDAYYSGWAPDSDYAYHCDSEGGQSGAPVLLYGDNRAFAIHHFGNVPIGACGNSGVKMFHIWPRIARFFDGVPVGDNEAPVEGPTVKAQVSCTDNVCDYASEGTVGENLYWLFGDGGSSTTASGTHTYTTPGLYDIVLYASRNGVTDAATVQVQVIVPNYNAPPKAQFVYTIDGLSVHFRSTSYDPEGQPLTYAWRLRDPLESEFRYFTESEFTHTYPAAGEDKYADLTVTDDVGNRSSTYFARLTVEGPSPCGNGTCDTGETWETCPADCPKPPDPCGNGTCDAGETYQTCPADCDAPTPEITLNYTARRVRGPEYDITLKWTGADGEAVYLYRGSVRSSVYNDGEETYRMHKREKGTTFRLCDDDQCSRTISVDF